MFTSLLAATALAATPTLTIRRDCDAAGGLPSAKAPLTVAYTSTNGKVAGTATLGTLGIGSMNGSAGRPTPSL